MFTGIIEKTVSVRAIRRHQKGIRVRFEKPRGWKLVIGQSISINGVCSTVVARTTRTFDVVYMPETLLKTTVRSLKKNSIVNLERSLVYGARIEGHFVLGHVDTVARVTALTKQGSSRLIATQIPVQFRPYVALHGSITINGVALTVARLRGRTCTVALIPYTLEHTNLGAILEKDTVNLEVDYLARYGIAEMRGSGTVLRNATKRIQKRTPRR